MRVLHFYRTSFPDTMGGIEQVIHQIALGSSKLGVQTDVLSLSADNHAQVTQMDGYQIHRAKLDVQIASTGFSVSAFGKYTELARRADIIHFQFPWPFMDLVHFATRVKKPTVVSYQSDIVRQKTLLKFYKPVMHRFLASVDGIVASSPNYLATSEVLQRHRDKVTVIPNGLERSSYPPASEMLLDYWRERLGPKFFLFVGVIRYYKGLHVLLEAARDTNFPIVIVGAGPVEQELKAQAEQLGLSNVHFLGLLPDDDKIALLTLSYALVFPSHLRSEAFGVSLVEGAMYGKPLISCEIGTGTTYINIDGETGLSVPPSNPAALRHAMQTLWNNEEMAAAMGQRAERRYQDLFTAEHMVSSYVDLYGELIGKYRGT